MRTFSSKAAIVLMLLALLPVMTLAQETSVPPPVSQPLVNEGMLAVRLASVLGLNSTDDAVAAESRLGEVGISPRNGWIADYPVTPDVLAEVRDSVAPAFQDQELSLSPEEALKRYDDVATGFGLPVRPYTASEPAREAPTCETYPDPAAVSTIYGSEGPPVVTYYCPPPNYYNYYTWVPYPFWWTDFWFPGFFVLQDFHRFAVVGHRHVLFTNHFNDIRRHRVFRIDPGNRSRGRTFAGIGVTNRRGFISTGVPHSSRTIFNAPRRGFAPGGGVHQPSFRTRVPAAPSIHGGGTGGIRGSGAGGIHGGRCW